LLKTTNEGDVMKPKIAKSSQKFIIRCKVLTDTDKGKEYQNYLGEAIGNPNGIVITGNDKIKTKLLDHNDKILYLVDEKYYDYDVDNIFNQVEVTSYEQE